MYNFTKLKEQRLNNPAEKHPFITVLLVVGLVVISDMVFNWFSYVVNYMEELFYVIATILTYYAVF